MTKRVEFTVSARTSARPPVVYRLLCSGATWPEWSPIGSFLLEREGSGGGESLGAIRMFKTGTVKSREELVEMRPDEQLSYRSLSGLPLRAHRADVGLEEDDGVTTIRWREVFEPKIPGTGLLLEVFLRRFVARCADGLAAYAGERASHPDSTAGGTSDDR